MLTNLLILITGIIGFITTGIAILNQKSNHFLNRYLIIILTIISFRFLFRGIALLWQNELLLGYALYFELLFITMIPCLFLYFRNLIGEEKWDKKDLYHFIPIAGILILFSANNCQSTVYNKMIGMFYFAVLVINYLIYIYLCYQLLHGRIWSVKKTVSVISKQQLLIKNWTVFLYCAFVILLFKIIVLFIISDFHFTLKTNNSQVGFAAIIWLVIFIKLLATPEILYGYDFMKTTVGDYKTQHIILDKVWLFNNKPEITNQKDLKIKENLTINLERYISEIGTLSLNSNTFRDPAITLSGFARKLDIPFVHLNYVFKYHSSISFVDYKKIIRIKDAIELLKSNFLKTNTIESLAREVGFSSYMPFFNGFKAITGQSPQEYFETVVNQERGIVNSE